MTRMPRFAGRHYFADAGRLRASVESFIEDAHPVRMAGELCALIVPHGTHREFGAIAGFAYKVLLTTPSRWNNTTVLAPTTAHGSPHLSVLLCDPSAAYDTPIDPVQIDRASFEALQKAGVPLRLDPDDEPAIEDQLPFIQVALGDVPILPLRAPVGFDGTTLTRFADPLGLIIAVANLPLAQTEAACDAITRLDEHFFLGAKPIGKSKRLSAWFGLGTKRVKSAPSIDASADASADASIYALAIGLAKANGANTAQLLKREDQLAAFALFRASSQRP